MKRHLTLTLTLGLLCMALTSGCQNPSHLVFQQGTCVGVDAAANTETGQVHVVVGYDRSTNTMIPKTKTYLDGQTQSEPTEQEAMSVISASEVKVKWLGLHEVTEQFATGKAARNLASDPQAAGQVLTLSIPASQKSNP